MRTHTNKEKAAIIENYMKKLSISLEEAEELYAFDFLNEPNSEADLLTKLAHENGTDKIYEREVKADKPKRTRARKTDNTKLYISDIAKDKIAEFATITSYVPEKTIDFIFEEKSYTLKLTKHNSYVGIKESKAEKRKVNAPKAFILNELSNVFSHEEQITKLLVQTETKINFNFAETNYTLALTAHR
jgi:hypothetical protein